MQTVHPLPTMISAADSDRAETQEWLDAIDSLIVADGPARTRYVLDRMLARARPWR